MMFFILIKGFASIVTGMLGIPIGILPSIFLYRDLANGVDDDPKAKRSYARTLWAGMVCSWAITSLLVWYFIGLVFG